MNLTKKLFTLTFFAAASLATCSGQQVRMLDVDIAQEFKAGRTVLPPGKYRFALMPGGPVLQIAGPNGSANLRIIDRLRGPEAQFREGSLVFDVVGDSRILSEVWVPEEGGVVVSTTSEPHGHHIVVAVMAAEEMAKLSGRAVYERTCLKCHGPGGRGSQAADRFFGVAIPRLHSEYVQSKTDEDIKRVVREGRGNMEAVRMGQSAVRHLLPDSTVDSVLAYLRTLRAR